MWRSESALPYGIADAPAVSVEKSLFLFGGYGQSPRDVKSTVLELSEHQWRYKSSMQMERWGSSAIIYDNQAYTFGGCKFLYVPNRLAELYDFENDRWTSLGNIPKALCGHGLMTATAESRIFLFFRNLTYEFDPNRLWYGRYKRRKDAPIPRTWGTCGTVNVNGESRVYIIGGYDFNKNRPTNENYYYIPSLDEWSPPQPPAPYAAYGVTRDNPVWKDDIYYGFGHTDYPNQFFAKMSKYDPTKTVWSELPTAVHERDGVGCTIIDGVLYVVGGRNHPDDNLAFGLPYTETLNL